MIVPILAVLGCIGGGLYLAVQGVLDRVASRRLVSALVTGKEIKRRTRRQNGRTVTRKAHRTTFDVEGRSQWVQRRWVYTDYPKGSRVPLLLRGRRIVAVADENGELVRYLDGIGGIVAGAGLVVFGVFVAIASLS